MKPELVILRTGAELIQRLRSEGKRLPYVSYAVGNGQNVTKSERLDAMKVSQMDAVERYGFDPPHPILEARVLKAPQPSDGTGVAAVCDFWSCSAQRLSA